MIKTIIFDLGKVIVPFDFMRAYKRFEAVSGVPVPEIRARLGASGLYNIFESGAMDGPGFVGAVNQLLGTNVPYDEFCEIWSSIFLPETFVSGSFLQALRRKYRLVLLSNTNVIHFEMIQENYPLLRHFDALILSYEVKAMKPHLDIYRHAVAAAGCGAGECLFIDDIAENVEGARHAGLHAVQFHSTEILEQDFRAHGITWE